MFGKDGKVVGNDFKRSTPMDMKASKICLSVKRLTEKMENGLVGVPHTYIQIYMVYVN